MPSESGAAPPLLVLAELLFNSGAMPGYSVNEPSVPNEGTVFQNVDFVTGKPKDGCLFAGWMKGANEK